MKTFTATFGIDTQFGRQQRRLLIHLGLLATLVVALCLVTMSWFDRRTVDSLSRGLIDKTAFAVEQRLDGLFRGAESDLRIVSHQLQLIDVLDPDSGRKLYLALTPILRENPSITAIIVADTDGNQYFLRREADAFTSGVIDVRSGDTRTTRGGSLASGGSGRVVDPTNGIRSARTPVVQGCPGGRIRADVLDRPLYLLHQQAARGDGLQQVEAQGR